ARSYFALRLCRRDLLLMCRALLTPAAPAFTARPPQHEGAVPATGQNTLRLPKCALSAPSQRKPLESHDLVTTPRVHHAAGGAAVAWPRQSFCDELSHR